MSTALSLPAPAKLNLFLHITGRRADGYHELQTVFQLLDWGDTLHFEANDSGVIRVQGDLPGTATEDNLITRAAARLKTGADDALGADITLHKRIPLGGGLGGGSSDAATSLLALNQLWHLNHTLDTLAAIGAELGADVPVFVHGRSAWAEGIGEKLTPIELPERWYLVVTPACQVSTAEVFSHPQLTRNSSPIKMAAFFQGASRNDCQDLVRTLYPDVAKVLNFLSKLGEARLTGTGACVFVSCENRGAAEAAQRQLPQDWQSFVARGINPSPVHDILASHR